MADYAVRLKASAHRELETLSKPVLRRTVAKIELLRKAPRPAGCKKLRGTLDLWRIRVGEYRVVYSIDDEHRVTNPIPPPLFD